MLGKEPFVNISQGLLLYRNWTATFEVQSQTADYKYITADVERLWICCFVKGRKLQHARRCTLLICLALEVFKK